MAIAYVGERVHQTNGSQTNTTAYNPSANTTVGNTLIVASTAAGVSTKTISSISS